MTNAVDAPCPIEGCVVEGQLVHIALAEGNPIGKARSLGLLPGVSHELCEEVETGDVSAGPDSFGEQQGMAADPASRIQTFAPLRRIEHPDGLADRRVAEWDREFLLFEVGFHVGHHVLRRPTFCPG